jgi:hypothetical protein
MASQAEKREALAQLLAENVPPGPASKQAGYAHCWKDPAQARANRADTVTRVAEIRRAKAHAATDLTPMIDALMAAASGKDADELKKTAAGLTAIRGLLVEAARLKGLAPPAPHLQPSQSRTRMTDEEWMEAFAPKPGAGS